jgi:amino acid adenylation domain-containing protein
MEDLKQASVRIEDSSFQCPAPGIEAARRAAPVPLSFAQARLWFLDQLQPNSAFYNVPLRIGLTGPLHVDALAHALTAVVERHAVLRTTYECVNGEPVQKVNTARAVELPVECLAASPPETRELAMQNLSQAEALRPFDLSRDFPLRARLTNISPAEHVLLITIHHIAFDGWSMKILLQDLAAFYRAHRTGTVATLEPAPQYAEYAVAQRRLYEQGEFASQLEAWKKQLGDEFTFQQIPTDRSRPALQTYRGATECLELSPETMQKLRSLAKSQRVSVFMIVLAALKVLLHRYGGGQKEVLVGTPIANRTRAEFEQTIGFFVNTLLLRTDVSGNPTFRELLTRVREVTLAAYENQEAPFEKIVEMMQPARDLSHGPLIQVMLVAGDMPGEAVEFAPELTGRYLKTYSEAAKFDLTFTFHTQPEGAIYCRYNSDLFARATVERLLRHLQALLMSCSEDAEQPISSLPMLSAMERQQLIADWNQTGREYPPLPVAELFQQQVARTPHAIALVAGGASFTYRQLNAAANRLAHRLISLGIAPQEKVGIAMERSPELIAAILAILKAGAAYVPLDPAYPKERHEFMLRDCAVRFVLTRPGAELCAFGSETQAIEITFAPQEDGGVESQNPAARADIDSLAYVMYTSGSTGRPKGVEIRHRGIVRLVLGSEFAELNANQVLLQLAPTAFDASTFEIWGALLHGGRLVLFPGGLPDVDELRETIARHGVTTLWLTTSLFNAIVDEAPEALAGVRQLLAGGEALSVRHVLRALNELPNTKLINGYGPTESTTFACCYPIPRDLAPSSVSIPIGRPIANTRIYILDPNLQPVPIGAIGELYIGGDGLARGYVNLPELTQEKFIPDPFAPGGRLYKTGDLARYLPEGEIEFIGRADNQVKIRGFRIEPGEIETVLRQHPWIKDGAIVVGENRRREKYLLAYVVASAGPNLAPAELRSYLKKTLPDYMVPQKFIFLDKLPLNPNGKLDRKALPDPLAARTSRPDAAVTNTRGRDEIEEGLLEIWAKLLRRQAVSRTDNFFDLGGHSLLATNLLAQVRRRFDRQLSVAQLFQAPTIEQLAELLRTPGVGEQIPAVIPIQPHGTRPAFYCVGAGPMFRAVSDGLGPDQPLLGITLDETDLSGIEAPYQVENIARVLLKKIRQYQPKGPYLLGGWCQDGVVAWEMAQQLAAEGEPPVLVVLFDTQNPNDRRGVAQRDLWRARFAVARYKSRAHWRQLRREGPGPYLREHARGLIFRVRDAIWRRQYRMHASQGKSFSIAGRTHDEMLQLAVPQYSPNPYPGPVAFFQADQPPLVAQPNLVQGWRGIARRLQIFRFPGPHQSMLEEPYVHDFARALGKCLRAAQAELDGSVRPDGGLRAPHVELPVKLGAGPWENRQERRVA